LAFPIYQPDISRRKRGNFHVVNQFQNSYCRMIALGASGGWAWSSHGMGFTCSGMFYIYRIFAKKRIVTNFSCLFRRTSARAMSTCKVEIQGMAVGMAMRQAKQVHSVSYADFIITRVVIQRTS